MNGWARLKPGPIENCRVCGFMGAFHDEPTLRIESVGSIAAFSVEFQCPESSGTWYFEDSGFWLGAGEEREVRLYSTLPIEGDGKALTSVYRHSPERRRGGRQ
jgi:hypothetical protein